MENQNMEVMEVKKKGISKRAIFVIAALVCCIAAVATGTLAYFTAEETSYNVITTGLLYMDLVEETTDEAPWPEEGYAGIMPGQEIDKIPYVVNRGGIDFFTRMSVEVRVYGADGNELPADGIIIDYNTTEWSEKEGYYYYNNVVTSGEETVPLFTTVTFDKDMGNEYQNGRVEVIVSAQAVQSKNNAEAAVDAVGWADAE